MSTRSLATQAKTVSPPTPLFTAVRLKPLKRRSVDQTATDSVPPMVHEVLRSPGRPLDPSTRRFMEPRFGHDFSRVRVHTDAKAAASAQAVEALAYTVGEDVVLGTGGPGQETPAGRRLLAHELTHVVQQSQVRPPLKPPRAISQYQQAPALQRVPEVNDSCGSTERRNIIEAQQLAIRWVRFALTQLRNPARVAPQLSWNFRAEPRDTATLDAIRAHLGGVLRELAGDFIIYYCIPDSDPRCRVEGRPEIAGFAYLGGHDVYFCGGLVSQDPDFIVETLLHEALHAKAPGIPDGPYQNDPDFPGVDPVDNCDAYTGLVSDIAEGVLGVPQPPMREAFGSLFTESCGLAMEGIRMTTELRGFLPGGDSLPREAQNCLNFFLEEWVEFEPEGPTALHVAGHTDGRTPGEGAPNLGERRAVAVRDFLLTNLDAFGITAPVEVRFVNYGDSRPYTQSHTPRGNALNRRVSIEVIRLTPRQSD